MKFNSLITAVNVITTPRRLCKECIYHRAVTLIEKPKVVVEVNSVKVNFSKAPVRIAADEPVPRLRKF